jgi:nucleoid-associated protein YgaU
MRRRQLVVAVGWALALSAVAVALQWAGRGPLAAPPLTDPGRWGAWLDGRTPVVAAFAVLRLLAVGALWYVVVAAFVGAVLRLVGAASLVRVADRFTIGPVRRLVAGSVSLGLASSGLPAVAAPALRATPAAAQTTTTSTRPPTTDTVTMHRLGPADAPPPLAVAPLTRLEPGRWTVKSGECFWSIAQSVMSDRLGRAPTDAEIVPYWRRLIDTNRRDLVNAGDPDLIVPGQVFTIPGS